MSKRKFVRGSYTLAANITDPDAYYQEHKAAIDGDKLVESLRLITTCWSISPFVSKEKHNGAVDMLREVEREVKEAPTLTPPTEWVSVDERMPEPGERVLATDCGFVGEFYINKRGKWQRYNVNCSELLMALDILYWMPLPAPPEKEE